MFSGFRSRCTTPALCAPAMPSVIWITSPERLLQLMVGPFHRDDVAGDAFHRVVVLAVVFADIEDPHHVGCDLSRQLHLAVESRHRIGDSARSLRRIFSALPRRARGPSPCTPTPCLPRPAAPRARSDLRSATRGCAREASFGGRLPGASTTGSRASKTRCRRLAPSRSAIGTRARVWMPSGPGASVATAAWAHRTAVFRRGAVVRRHAASSPDANRAQALGRALLPVLPSHAVVCAETTSCSRSPCSCSAAADAAGLHRAGLRPSRPRMDSGASHQRAAAVPPPVVVVADDDRVMREHICSICAPNGYRPEPAGDGQEPWTWWRAAVWIWCCSDVMMPRLSGIDALPDHQGDGDRVLTPVLLVRSRPTPRAGRGLKIGADDYVPKPFEQRGVARTHRVDAAHQRLNDHLVSSVRSSSGSASTTSSLAYTTTVPAYEARRGVQRAERYHEPLRLRRR